MALAPRFGLSDCYIIPDDAVEALTGNRMYPKARGYSTPAGAAKKLRRHGFDTVEDAFRAKFAEISPSHAQRGDIGVIERKGEITGGVFTQLGFFTQAEDRPMFLPALDAKTAFRVE